MTITKAAIAEFFYTGKLREVEGEYIPCDYGVGCCSLPFLFISYLLPLLALVVSFGHYIVRKPESLKNFYLKLNSLDTQANVIIICLILFIICFSSWLFFTGLSELKLIMQSLQEAQYQRKHQQYRYGLLLTQDYLAIRCFSHLQNTQTIRLSSKIIKSFTEEPVIFSRTEIIDIFLQSDRLETKQRIYYRQFKFEVQHLGSF
jgi:hypothetical protein